ncbi:hypothetical protein VTO42DRAFT_790 [Malbranchea cinnamomea]
MEEALRLTVASTWKFDTDGVDEIRARFKRFSKDGYCKYDFSDDVSVFTIEGCKCGISKPAAHLTRLLATFIDDEKDNDLLEKPKISRIVPPTATDIYHDEQDVDLDSEGALIEDIFSPAESAKIPLAIKYWPPHGGGVDCFIRCPYDILGQLAKLSGASVVLEAENRRIRVSSPHAEQVEEVIEKLSCLEEVLSLVISPRAANILNVGNAQDFFVRLTLYKTLNEAALRRILVDPGSKIAGLVCRMFSTSIEFVYAKARTTAAPPNVLRPPRPTEVRKGGSKVWADFLFPELGDPINVPNLTSAVGHAARSNVHQGHNSIRNVTEGDPVQEETVNHPFLSREKASIVNKWAEEVEGGEASVSSRNPSPPEPILPEPVVPRVAGIKKRRVVPSGGKDLISACTRAEMPPVTERKVAERNESVATPEHLLTVDATVSISVNAKGETNKEVSPKAPAQNQALSASPRRKSRSQNLLIDLSDDDSNKPASAMPSMSFYQEPLVPLRVQVQENSNSVESNGSVLASDIKREREQTVSETETRTFHRTMRHQAGKTETKVEQRAKRQAALAEAWGPLPRANARTIKPSAGPEPSAWKKAKLTALERIDEEMAQNIADSLRPVLNAAKYFPGALSLTIQLGIVLVHGPPREYTDRSFDVKKWNRLFRPQNGLPAPTTNFLNMLTTSGADADYILDLMTEKDGAATRMFSEEPSKRSVRYEFHCQTRDNEEIVICVDQTGNTKVNRQEMLLGSVNVHCPRNIWDMSVVVKGTQEYSPGANSEVDSAIQTLIDKLYVFPKRERIMMFTRVPGGDELRVTKVLMRRSTMHRYIPEDGPSAPAAHIAAGAVKDHTSSDAGSSTLPLDEQLSEGVFLQIMEVQSLYLGHATTDKTLFRARALSPDEMVEGSRLWYEVSIVNPTIEGLLQSNRDVELGSCTTAWAPSVLLGDEQQPPAATKDTSQNGSNVSQSSGFLAGPTILGLMYRVANQVVQRIDCVGWGNQGACLDLPDQLGVNGSVIGRSGIGIPNYSVAPTTVYLRHKGSDTATNKQIQPMDSISVKSPGMGDDEFW